MKAVRVENFHGDAWLGTLLSHLTSRFPGARVRQRNAGTALVHLNTLRPWNAEDEAFFASLKQQGFIQRWEPLEEVPPEPKRNKAVYEDIGYRIGSGERLTARQQEKLFSQLQDLEERAERAEADLATSRMLGESASEYAQRSIREYNALIDMLQEETKGIAITSRGVEDLWNVEDEQSGQVLARDVHFVMRVYLNTL